MLSICFAILLSLPSVTALSLNVSELISEPEKQCTCNNAIKQLYAELRETQERVNALKVSNPIEKIASDFPANIDVRAVYPDVVGFTVVLSNSVSDLPTGSTILYDGIRFNAGSAYDPSTGIFTCPTSGIYLFATFVASSKNGAVRTADVSLKINGQYFVSAVSEPTEDFQDSTGGNILVRHLVNGDRVWVETFKPDNQDLYKDFTSFSGVLIQSTQNVK